MKLKSTSDTVKILEQNGELLRINDEVDPYLEMAEIQRRIYKKNGPAILFENVKGCNFPCVSNIYGTPDRARLLFKSSYKAVQSIIGAKGNPLGLFRKPLGAFKAITTAGYGLPIKVANSLAPVMQCRAKLEDLPQIVSWPMDGGSFITLPQVYSEHPEHLGNPLKSNLGMYRIQISGNEYLPNKEIGLHYQIHRGIGVHQKLHNDQEKEFKVAVFIGGPPAMAFSAVMPLPEGLPEVAFSGLMANRNFRYTKFKGWTLAADADFAIIGTIKSKMKPEGPFGDHLGYYSLVHDFPCMEVEQVFHRKDAIWPFTVVGRPPQEDTTFGEVIHDLTGSVISTELPGLHAVNAVDASGVHPLLLAVGEERYTPFMDTSRPSELLTIANAILGKGQLSLAKYLLIANEADKPDIHDIPRFFSHLLERINWKRDIHFQTETTIDTLDYSSEEINIGSKVIWACTGEPIRELSDTKPSLDIALDCAIVNPGILAVKGIKSIDYKKAPEEIESIIEELKDKVDSDAFPLIVVCDDPDFISSDFNNFLWAAFTRSNPSHDIYGINSKTNFKHWGCSGSLVIDARFKPHNAPPLLEDQKVSSNVDRILENINY
ncbi:MAG: UbiD family decarboxylase [Pontiellaceae bacterium]